MQWCIQGGFGRLPETRPLQKISYKIGYFDKNISLETPCAYFGNLSCKFRNLPRALDSPLKLLWEDISKYFEYQQVHYNDNFMIGKQR